MKFEETIRDLQFLNKENFHWRHKFLFYLWGSWLYNPVRDNLLAKIRAKSNLGISDERSSERSANTMPDTKSKDEEVSPEDIGLLPKMHPIARAYQILTNTTLIIMFVKLTILFLDPKETLTSSYYLRCYMPKFVIVEDFEDRFFNIFSYVLCFNHLLWRFVVLKFDKKLDLDVIPFLLAKTSLVQERIQLGAERLNVLGGGNLDLLDESMFTRVRNEHILRPNRSLSARNELIKTIDFYFNGAAIIVIILLVSTFPFGLYGLGLRQRYIFTNCSEPLTASNAMYIYRIFSCGLVSLIFFTDGMIAMFFISMCGYLFAVDLLIYWRQVRARIDKCHHKTAAELLHPGSSGSSSLSSATCDDLDAGQMSRVYGRTWTKYYAYKQERLTGKAAGNYGGRFYRTRYIDEHLCELKWALIDFFAQLRKVDQFVTLLIAGTVGVWQTCNFAIDFSGLQLSSKTNSQLIAIRSYQLIGIIVATGSCSLILRLKRNTEPAYPLLCGIVARDRSSNKRIWVRLLGIYTQRPHYAFTFLGGSIFSRLTFIKIISYTLTVIVIVEGMRWRHYNV